MNLGDLIHELRHNILHDRSNEVDGDGADYLWSDTTLVRYIDAAQRRFARRALVIRDATTPQCCQVTLVALQTEYPLDPSVIGVISAKYGSDPADLARAGHSALGTYRAPDPYFFDTSNLSSLQPGKPVAYATDESVTADTNGTMAVVNLRSYPAPTAAFIGSPINLRVVRMPLARLDLTTLGQVPEVPEDYHLDMLDWAAYLALRIVDHDAGDPARANEFRASFEDHVKTARTEMLRKMFAPMQWGFGRSGWSYEGN